MIVAFLALAPVASGAYAAADKKQKAGKLSCDQQKKRYAESEACFAKYRKADKSMKPEAFKKCIELKDPQC